MTSTFLLLSSDYNVVSSTVIALNNFIEHTHCHVVQLFQLTSLLIKAFTTITKQIVCPYVRFSEYGSSPLIFENNSNIFSKFSWLKLFFL